VTGDSVLIDLEKHCVAIAVKVQGSYILDVAGRFAFDPPARTTPRVIGGPAALMSLSESSLIHPRNHENPPGVPLLDYHRNETGVIEAHASDHRIDRFRE